MTEHHRYRRLYTAWQRIQAQCNDRNCPTFKHYGAKGIIVCEEWDDYHAFRDWAISQGYEPDAPRGACTVQRIDPNDDFCPDNCFVKWKNPHQ